MDLAEIDDPIEQYETMTRSHAWPMREVGFHLGLRPLPYCTHTGA